MWLGYNTNGLQSHRLDDALRLVADKGFQGVALTPDVGHLDPLVCTAREVEQAAALIERLGLRVAIETGARFVLDPANKHEPTLMTRDRQARERRFDLYHRCARIGRDLGAEVLSFWAGVDRVPGPDSTGWLLEGVARTCEVVAEQGLTAALEPEPGMAVGTVAEFDELTSAMDSSAPALCLDVGHLYVTGEAEPDAVIAARADRLVQVHLEDMVRGVHEHLPPGEGDVDFTLVRSALEAQGYAGPVCFELSRSSHCAPDAMDLCLAAWAGSPS